MKFYDEAKITITSGKGGDGTITGRRESGVPFGGPSGGNGGRGGSIIFQASKDENTLLPYKFRTIHKGKPGENGKSKDQYGANAEDITLIVPVGTMIRDEENNLLHVFANDGEKRTALKGGEGGVGNMHFKDAVRQYPNFCLLGEPGHTKNLHLELQLIADVALIGTPSVGKSSLINSVSHTKAKVAEYPFTTLVPNLGSVQVEETHFNMIDIPGLIEGAAEGKGLGNAFLRHILKARSFCFIADMSRYNEGIHEIPLLLEEIDRYIAAEFGIDEKEIIDDKWMLTLIAKKEGEIILEKRLVLVFNKYDLVNDAEIAKEYMTTCIDELLAFLKAKKRGKKLTKKVIQENSFIVSAATHYGTDERLHRLLALLERTSPEESYHITFHDILPTDEEKGEVIKNISDTDKQKLIDESYIEEAQAKYCEVWEIQDAELCKLVRMLPRGNEEAEQRFRNIIEHKGILENRHNAGIHKGDIIKVKSFYAGREDRYILY